MQDDLSSLSAASVFGDAVVFNLRAYYHFMAQSTADNAKDFTAHHTACKAALAHIEALLKLHQQCTASPDKQSTDRSPPIEPLLQQARSARKRLLLMAFRGCGKSTLVGLFCAWLLCHNPDTRILIIAADELLAENMLRHIRSIIESHPIAKALLPKQKQAWAADRLIVTRAGTHRDPSIRAAGLYSNLTGSRADIIICDDVEVPNTCDTKLKRQKLRQTLHELDFILVPDGMILYIGTPHTEDSIYKKDGFLGSYARLEIPLHDTTWPERFSAEMIAHLQHSVGARVFASQMLLQPLSLHEARLNPHDITIYTHEIDVLSSSCYWDPAFGHTKGDNSVIALVQFDKNDHAYLHDLEYIRVSPHSHEDAATQQCNAVIAFLMRHNIHHLRIEGNGIGQFLPGLLRKHLKQAHYPCSVQVIHTGTNKNTRILQAFETRLAARALSMHARVSVTGFPDEMTMWQADTPHNQDDALDAVAGALLHHVPRYHHTPQYFVKEE